MKFDFDVFNKIDNKVGKRDYLSGLDKEQFKYKPYNNSITVWSCPSQNCPHQALNKNNLFKHMAVPCKQISQWACPFNYWQEDTSLIGDFNIGYPDIYVEKLFKNYVIKRISENPAGEEHIFKLFPYKVFGDLWCRSKFSSFTKTTGKIVLIKDKHLEWVDSKSPDGKLIIKKIIDKWILDFISRNIVGWANWHTGNSIYIELYYRFKDLVLEDRTNPHIIEI
tara:strand:+ start:1000 stop:1668 length:669 start_codon:yes stop_codon:yes gene_type:complete